MAESPDPSVDPELPDAMPPTIDPPGPIVARPAKEYRIKRFLLVVLLLGYGLLSVRDGFFVYPRENEQARREHPGSAKLKHGAYDIPLNRAFGIGLPPLALLLLCWSLYSSRGQYELDLNEVLRIPGHPPIPLSAVAAVDRAKWDRKGIALIEYEVPGGAKGRAKLDDFIYQREPTDRIFDRILASITVPDAPGERTPGRRDRH